MIGIFTGFVGKSLDEIELTRTQSPAQEDETYWSAATHRSCGISFL